MILRLLHPGLLRAHRHDNFSVDPGFDQFYGPSRGETVDELPVFAEDIVLAWEAIARRVTFAINPLTINKINQSRIHGHPATVNRTGEVRSPVTSP